MADKYKIPGARFGRLIMVERVTNPDARGIHWFCDCDCGSRRIYRQVDMVKGLALSCGCGAKVFPGPDDRVERMRMTEATERHHEALREASGIRQPFSADGARIVHALTDPPWHFKTYDGKRSVPGRAAADPYATMRMADLMALPVQSIAAPDAVLFLWTVSYLQDEATDLARAWGFAPKSLAFVWDKGSIGMGYWTRQQVEICKLYTRGKPKRLSKGVRQLIRAPRREHSRKPDEQYPLIEALVDGPRAELFARTSRPGWTAWGLEVGRLDAEVAA